MIRTLLLTALLLLAANAQAQAPAASPYAGFEERPIKALSAQQISDLKAGRGMGLALAAELNGFPGPLHVLELAAKLELTDEQQAKVEQLFADMKAEAVPIGERLIGQEGDLDRQFASRTVTPASLAAGTEAIGLTQGGLRNAHLKISPCDIGGSDAVANRALRHVARLFRAWAASRSSLKLVRQPMPESTAPRVAFWICR